MDEQPTGDDVDRQAGRGAGDHAETPGDGTGPEGLGDGERMARRLVQDVSAFEVDPPPPSRAEERSSDPVPE